MKRIALFLGIMLSTTMAYAGFQAYNGTTSLNIFDKIQCSTGLTCTRSNGRLLMVSSPTVSGAAITIQGIEATDGILNISTDDSDDNGDDWAIKSEATGNALNFLNDTSGSLVSKFKISTAGNLTIVGTVTGDGGDALSGFLQKQITSTTTTLTAAQCGSTIVNDSADVLTLPEASTVLGCRYTFVVANASNLDINPNDATDLILPFHLYESTAISPSAGDAIRSATLGASITIEAVGANAWAVVDVVDTWADVN